MWVPLCAGGKFCPGGLRFFDRWITFVVSDLDEPPTFKAGDMTSLK